MPGLQTEASLPDLAPRAPDDASRIAAQQRLRERRLLMAMGSYGFTLALVWSYGYMDLLPAQVAWRYFGILAAVNLFFFALFRSGLNLRLRDPSVTFAQAAVSILPSLYVLWFLDHPQARTALAFLSVIPALYGVMALNTRRLLGLIGWFLASYATLVLTLSWLRPERVDGFTEGLLLVSLTLVLVQVALLGGYLSQLRSNLRKRNNELNDALARLNEFAVRDGLTGAYNRRYLVDAISREISRAERGGGVFSVAMLDIDHFKEINDAYGHQAGDDVLRQTVESIGANLREADTFGRWGGEEFLLLLPDTPLTGAATTAERARRQFETLTFDDLEPDLKITVSIGVAEWTRGETLDGIVARADEALYRAKFSGRNRLETDPSPPPAIPANATSTAE